MSEHSSSEDSSRGPDRPGGAEWRPADSSELKGLIQTATQERKNLQLLLDYFENNIGKLSDTRNYFEKFNQSLPDTFKKLDTLQSRLKEMRDLENSIGKFESTASSLEVKFKDLKQDLKNVNLLHEDVEQKTKSLDQQKRTVEKANAEAGRLLSLIHISEPTRPY